MQNQQKRLTRDVVLPIFGQSAVYYVPRQCHRCVEMSSHRINSATNGHMYAIPLDRAPLYASPHETNDGLKCG